MLLLIIIATLGILSLLIVAFTMKTVSRFKLEQKIQQKFIPVLLFDLKCKTPLVEEDSSAHCIFGYDKKDLSTIHRVLLLQLKKVRPLFKRTGCINEPWLFGQSPNVHYFISEVDKTTAHFIEGIYIHEAIQKICIDLTL